MDDGPSGSFSMEPRLTHEGFREVSEEETVFKIVMLRCGDIEWDIKKIYCGWYDAKLTTEGRQQIITASNSLKHDNYIFDLAYCSVLNRSRESLKILLNELGTPDIEIIPSWELNERHCGCLTVSINNELDKKIADAFDIFDHAGNRTVDIREIGTIIRSLGCVPSEAELQEILLATESHEARGSVHLSAFLPHMPATPDKLLEAFRKLDPEGHGYINREFLTKLIMEEGEPFTEDEVEEMMSTACDPQTQTIPYEYYINQLMYNPPDDDNMYWWADKIEAERPKPKDARTMTQLMRLAQEMQQQADDNLN